MVHRHWEARRLLGFQPARRVQTSSRIESPPLTRAYVNCQVGFPLKLLGHFALVIDNSILNMKITKW